MTLSLSEIFQYLNFFISIFAIYFVFRDSKYNKIRHIKALSETERKELNSKKQFRIRFAKTQVYIIPFVFGAFWLALSYATTNLTILDVVLVSYNVVIYVILLGMYVKELSNLYFDYRNSKTDDPTFTKDEIIEKILQENKKLREYIEYSSVQMKKQTKNIKKSIKQEKKGG